MRLEYVITREQGQTAAEARAQAQAEAAQARAQARADAERARQDARDIREQAHRIRDEIRQEIQEELRGRQGPQGPQGVIMMPPPAPPWEHGLSPQVMDLATMFVVAMVICIVGLPIARALGRWIDRRGLPSPVNAELAAQMNRIEQAVDTMSVEVERISEAQRFQAKLLAERESARA